MDPADLCIPAHCGDSGAELAFQAFHAVRSMKITCLMENTAASPEFAAEHGLSLHIEAAGRRLLFDMGQSSAFAANAARLGIDLATVDAAVLSHGHYDHGGGMARFLEINDHALVYHSSLAFGGHWHGEKYIGLDQALNGHPRLHPVEGNLFLGGGLALHSGGGMPCRHPIDSAGLTLVKAGVHVPETFDHEQYLVMEEHGRRVVISGCSHRGVANIAAWLKPDVLVGGFHLMKKTLPEDAPQLDALAAELLDSGAVFYTGHCTGDAAYAYLKERMGNRLHYLRAGEWVEL